MTCTKPVLASRHDARAKAANAQQSARRPLLPWGAPARLRLQTPEPPMPREVPTPPPAPPIDPSEPVAPPMEPPGPDMPPIGDPPDAPGSPRGGMLRPNERRNLAHDGYFY